jgi:hypothetical protein
MRGLRKCVPFFSKGATKPNKKVRIGKWELKGMSSKREGLQVSKLQRSSSSITQKRWYLSSKMIILDFSKVDDYWIKKW